MDYTSKPWNSKFWVGGRVYAEDPDHREPNRAQHEDGGEFSRAASFVPDDDGMINVRFELSETETKDNIDPFNAGGIGGHMIIRIADPNKRSKIAMLGITIVRFETTYARAPDVAADGARGSFTGLGRLETHPSPNSNMLEVEYSWLCTRKVFRLVGVLVKFPADAWKTTYEEGVLYAVGFQ